MSHNALKTHCINGHEFTPENTWIGTNTRNGVKHQARYCKTCISNRKRLRYQSDPKFRARSVAYNRWWRCGDPEGRMWSEIRAEIVT